MDGRGWGMLQFRNREGAHIMIMFHKKWVFPSPSRLLRHLSIADEHFNKIVSYRPILVESPSKSLKIPFFEVEAE